ncbi:SOS response-associated peptidase [Brucella pituitosa]|uniref:Abasic site processing protein n=1 Tax=Brucella pituitosa TaxID=571256 RepID=A0A643F664_9HYPH|nr:SOS response-associated peptidase [Brucella pituitosa]KAB0573364.1 SOS response-associated peptidase [Brucella pituitosa]
MCGRFTQTYTWAEIHAMYSLIPATPRNIQPRYNIAPTTQVGVITQDGDDLTYSEMRWWLVPSWWSKDLKSVPATFNARSEDIASKPMFRAAFKSTRCLIPATGFFEWSGPKEARLPWFISAKDSKPLTFAGLYETWRDRATGEEVKSCTIITCAANGFMATIHNRMPVILQESDWRAWLAEPRTDLLKPANDDVLQAWRVSTNVNSSRYQGEDTMERIER